MALSSGDLPGFTIALGVDRILVALGSHGQGDKVARWALIEDADGSVTWKQRLREWARSDLGPLVNAY
jgi:hypothetical protein